MRHRANDTVTTGPAVSWIVLRAALVAVVGTGAFVLCPLVGWQAAAVALAVVAAIFPPSFAAWGSVGCIVIGMLTSEPSLGRAMLAVLVVHLVQVLSSITLVVPRGTRVVLAALRPSTVRLIAVQAVAQPATAVVMLVAAGAGPTSPWAAVAGAGALAAVAVLLLVGADRLAR